MMNWLTLLTGSVDDSPAEHTNESPAKARASAMTVLVDIFDEFNSGDNPEVTIEGRVLSCKLSEEAVQEQGGRQVLQRLRAAVTELHKSGFLTYRDWNNKGWFARHPAMSMVCEYEEETPLTFMLHGRAYDYYDTLDELHPALNEIMRILNWLFCPYTHDFPPERTKNPSTSSKQKSNKSSKKAKHTTAKTLITKKKLTTKKSTTKKKEITKKK